MKRKQKKNLIKKNIYIIYNIMNNIYNKKYDETENLCRDNKNPLRKTDKNIHNSLKEQLVKNQNERLNLQRNAENLKKQYQVYYDDYANNYYVYKD
jgi:hypothetical protein